MGEFVIGVSSKLNETMAVALDRNGQLLAQVRGKSCSHVNLTKKIAQKHAVDLIEHLLSEFGGDRSECMGVLVGAAGIDSPNTKQKTMETFSSMHMLCPILCLNDGNVVLYSVTGGVGIAAIADVGTIVMGRSKENVIVRCGGYPITIFGDEGSLQWIALEAMHFASRWLDGCVGNTLLIQKMDAYFHGLDIEKMTECARALRRQPIDVAIASLVIDSAAAGDSEAQKILTNGALALCEVAHDCAKKLKFSPDEHFTVGVLGSVFQRSSIYFNAYADRIRQYYPAADVIPANKPEALACAEMALDYLNHKIPYINSLQ